QVGGFESDRSTLVEIGAELTAAARTVQHRTPRKSESRFQRWCFRISSSWGAAPGFYVKMRAFGATKCAQDSAVYSHYPGGQASARLPSKCTCKCGTLSPASGPQLITTRYPLDSSNSFATLRATRRSFPSKAASSSVASARRGTAFFGTISTCTGAWGSTS